MLVVVTTNIRPYARCTTMMRKVGWKQKDMQGVRVMKRGKT